MELLITSRVFPPALNPEATVTFRLARALSRFGVGVRVLTACGRELALGEAEPDLGEGTVTVSRVPPWRGGILRRGLQYVRAGMRKRVPLGSAWFVEEGEHLIAELIRAGRPDWIYARGYPPAAYFLAARSARKYRIPLAVHLSDPWPEYYAPPLYRKNRTVSMAACLERLSWESKVFSEARFITVPSRRLARFLARRVAGLRHKQLVVVPHLLPDEPLGGTEAGQNVQRPPEGTAPLRIVHAGTLSEVRKPIAFLLALRKVLDHSPGTIAATFVGPRWPRLAGIIRELELAQDVTLVDPVPHLEALKICASGDLLLLIEAPLEEGIFLPSKFVDYVSTGKPILALSPASSEVADYLCLIEERPVPPADVDGIARCLSRLVELREREGRLQSRTPELRAQFSAGSIVPPLLEAFSGAA